MEQGLVTFISLSMFHQTLRKELHFAKGFSGQRKRTSAAGMIGLSLRLPLGAASYFEAYYDSTLRFSKAWVDPRDRACAKTPCGQFSVKLFNPQLQTSTLLEVAAAVVQTAGLEGALR